MLEASSLGSSRCCAAAALLRELNDSVAGQFVEEEPAVLVSSNPAYFKNFDLVIATQARLRNAHHPPLPPSPPLAPRAFMVSGAKGAPLPALAAAD